MNLYHVTKFIPYFSFTVYCFYTKIGRFMPVLSKKIVLDCFYLLIFYFENSQLPFAVCRLPCAVSVNLNLSNNFTRAYMTTFNFRNLFAEGGKQLQKRISEAWCSSIMGVPTKMANALAHKHLLEGPPDPQLRFHRLWLKLFCHNVFACAIFLFI